MADLDALSRRLDAIHIPVAAVSGERKSKTTQTLSAKSFILYPEPTEPTKLKDEDSWGGYLRNVKQNVEAEY